MEDESQDAQKFGQAVGRSALRPPHLLLRYPLTSQLLLLCLRFLFLCSYSLRATDVLLSIQCNRLCPRFSARGPLLTATSRPAAGVFIEDGFIFLFALCCFLFCFVLVF